MKTKDIMVYVHSMEHGHVKVGTSKLPVNTVTLSVFDIKLLNIHDQHGRMMLTIPETLGIFHGLILPPPVRQPATLNQRIESARQTQPAIRKPNPEPQPEDDLSIDADLDAALEMTLKEVSESIMAEKQALESTHNLQDAMAKRPPTGLLARAGIKKT